MAGEGEEGNCVGRSSIQPLLLNIYYVSGIALGVGVT